MHPSDHTRFDIVMPGGRYIYLKASSKVERQQWVVALGTIKQEEEGTIQKCQFEPLSKCWHIEMNVALTVSIV